MFVNLTAANDTIWHRGCTCKFLKLLLDKRMIRIIMEFVQKRSFSLTTGSEKESRLRRSEKCCLTGIGLGFLLHKIYTYNTQILINKKYASAVHLMLREPEEPEVGFKPRHDIEALRKKFTSRVAFFRKLAGSV